MVRAIFRKPLTYFWRKFRPLTLLKNIGGEIISHRMVVMHPQFFLVVLLMVSYTILITLFQKMGDTFLRAKRVCQGNSCKT